MLLDYIIPTYKKYAFSGCKDTKFALAELGNDAGIYGAAKLVLLEARNNGSEAEASLRVRFFYDCAGSETDCRCPR